jgi:hypothetical protein
MIKHVVDDISSFLGGTFAKKLTNVWKCFTIPFWKAITDLNIFNSPDDGVDIQSGTKKEDLNEKEKKDEEETPAPTFRAKSILESWVWGKQPGIIIF